MNILGIISAIISILFIIREFIQVNKIERLAAYSQAISDSLNNLHTKSENLNPREIKTYLEGVITSSENPFNGEIQYINKNNWLLRILRFIRIKSKA